MAVWPCVSAYISLAYVFPVSPAAGGGRVPGRSIASRPHSASLPGLRSPHSALGLALRFIAYRFIAMHSEVACVCVPRFRSTARSRESDRERERFSPSIHGIRFSLSHTSRIARCVPSHTRHVRRRGTGRQKNEKSFNILLGTADGAVCRLLRRRSTPT